MKKTKSEGKKFRELTLEENKIIAEGETELPFSGEYYNFFEDGVYTCKRCGAALYSSKDKFNCGCGWPSFDDSVIGAVDKKADPDGIRTEIICKKCGAHLGHVFAGEHLTPKNIRHCVNSLSLLFIPDIDFKPDTAYFAAGCFWSVQYFFSEAQGVLDTSAGYMGGDLINPAYADVCTGKTGHAETVKITFNKAVISYKSLLKIFFSIHDPSQKNRQGPDIGSQYRSAVFYTSNDQKKEAEEFKKNLEDEGYSIVTEISPAGRFWKAEDYHQHYFKNKRIKPAFHKHIF